MSASHTPAPLPAGEDDGTPADDVRAAAIYVESAGDDPKLATVPDTLAIIRAHEARLLTLADALDALASAVKPMRLAYDAALYDRDYAPRTTEVDTLELRALLDCISSLTRTLP